MGIEIEKKYRLTAAQREQLIHRLIEAGAILRVEEFEENVLYRGGNLNPQTQVLRLRRAGGRAILTYKERFASASAIKHQREDETLIEDAGSLHDILRAIGFTPALVYEKRRATWHIADAEIAIDELPFGLFLEIEAAENSILELEETLCLSEAVAEMDSYPELAARHGTKRGEIIEARF
ncbi:MAG: class IV adenylate cyclase [Pyrinomonadaceae bacterium]